MWQDEQSNTEQADSPVTEWQAGTDLSEFSLVTFRIIDSKNLRRAHMYINGLPKKTQ